MTKEELITLGLTEDMAAKVIEKFNEDTKNLVPKEKLEMAEQAKAAFEKQAKELKSPYQCLKEDIKVDLYNFVQKIV